MEVVVAPDKFKGSLTASQVAHHVATGLRAAVPGLAVAEVPVADGGDGTVAAATSAGYRLHHLHRPDRFLYVVGAHDVGTRGHGDTGVRHRRSGRLRRRCHRCRRVYAPADVPFAVGIRF